MAVRFIPTISWVQRNEVFLYVMISLAIACGVLYAVAYFRERAGRSRARRLASARISAVGLFCFAAFLSIRVFAVHQ